MTSRNQQLFERARQRIPGGVNSPVRAFGSVGGTPPFLVSGRGARVTDADGKAYLDYVGSWGPLILGHAHPEVVAAVREAAGKGLSFGAPTEIEVDMAELLCGLLPSLDMVRLVSSGTEATMSAIRLARGYTGRDLLIKFEGCYHGHSDSLLVKAGSGLLTFGNPSSGGVPADLAQHTLVLDYNDDEAVEQAFAQHGERIAAVIVEPVAGSTGVLLPPKGYLQRLREIADRHGILVIFDEVITGFGRLGAPFATDYFGVTPDLMTTAKGLTNGVFPMGAVFARRAIHDALMTGPENAIELFHGYTYSGHPAGCAAGLATLDIYAEEGLLTRGATLGDYWRDAMHTLRDAPHVIDIRTLGLVAGIELRPRPDAAGARAYEAFVDCFNRGLLIRVTGDIIALSPPLIVERSHIDTIVAQLRDALSRLA